MTERTVTILIRRLRRRRGRETGLTVGAIGLASTDAAAASVGGTGPTDPGCLAAPPGAPPLLVGAPGAVIDARGLFANRRLEAALDSGDTEQLVAALEELQLG